MQSLYVDRAGGLCTLYWDSDTARTAHCVDNGEDVFATVKRISPVHFVIHRDTKATKGEWTGTLIRWEDGNEWRPLTMSSLQYKYLCQKPYVPMSLVFAYGCYTVVAALANGLSRAGRALFFLSK